MVPFESADVLIPKGKKVLMDVNIVKVGVLTIEGTLILASPSGHYELTADTIIINQGAFLVGEGQTIGYFYGASYSTYKIKLSGKKTVNGISRAIICNSCNLGLAGQTITPVDIRWA